ncbi:MAG: YHS domain-containing protein [Ignavibacteriales bacterium]|nr:YHS domain-containing protein [Ignavibacteriales bacterium]
MKFALRVLGLALLFTFGFALTVNAQAAKKQKKEAALHQYCPVAYGAMNKAVKGDAKFSSTYKGKTYYFAVADAKRMFDADPIKYLPKYDGFCATAFAMGKKVESDPEIFSVYKGATYLFSNKMAKEGFDKDPQMIVNGADKNLNILATK